MEVLVYQPRSRSHSYLKGLPLIAGLICTAAGCNGVIGEESSNDQAITGEGTTAPAVNGDTSATAAASGVQTAQLSRAARRARLRHTTPSTGSTGTGGSTGTSTTTPPSDTGVGSDAGTAPPASG
ncbi:MAG TPA: hypothetical protein VGL13_01615, partial [Polyangiaceae bacterium]